MIKQMKFEIFTKNKNILKLIFELMNETQYTVNRCVTLLWDWNNFKWEFKKRNGVFPDVKECFVSERGVGYTIKGALNNQINKEVNKLQSDSKDMAVATGFQLWNNSYKDVFVGKKSIPNFKGSRIFLKNRSIRIIKDNFEYYVDVGLFSKQFAKENNLESGRVSLDLKVCDNTQRTIVNKILSGEYKIAGSSISWSKNKLFINLGYDFEVKEKTDKNNVLGIDLGIKYVVFMAVSDSKKTCYIDGGEIDAFRNKTYRLQKSLRMQTKYCTQNNKGHGRKKRCENTEIIGNKISNFKNLKNHEYSKFIVDYAIKNNCGIIQMEDLTGISEYGKFLKQWTYYDLQQKIKYKAESNGIQFKLVKAAYTSQRCSECGNIDKNNRKTQEKFKCVSCGFETNADKNAAINLSILDIDEIIKLSM